MKSSSKQKKPVPLPGKEKRQAQAISLFSSLEKHFQHRKLFYVFSFIILAVILALTQFNYKVSEANDDSMYLEDAFKFSKDFFGYYTANAPFYSMLLSVLIRLFGFELMLLKMTGVVFMIFHLWFLYKAFENRIPYLILFFVILFTALNNYMLYFASMTFTEQFFMMQQGLFFYLFFKSYDQIKAGQAFISSLKNWILPGLSLFVMSLSRNVAIGIIIPVFAFLLFDKKFKSIISFLVGFLIFRTPFEIFRKAMWGAQDQYSNQVTKLIRWKDPYDPSKGVEDFNGFVERFTGNYGLYICKRFFQIIGFVSDNDFTIHPGLGFIFFVLLAIASFFIIRHKEKHLLFVLLYTGALTCITFIVLQTRWDQPRMILIFVPLIFIILITPIYNLVRNKSRFSQILFILFPFIIIVSVLISTINETAANLPVIKKNLKGEIFYGYTNDWQNFLKLSRWCADSLPPDAYVASRKAPMSFIYGKGKQFFPVYQADVTDPDSVLALFKKENVTHVILASLRRNPQKNDGYIINTMHRMLIPVSQKYPEKLTLVKQVGASEPAYLYKINY